MSEIVLTRERILEAAEDVLRRFGPAKANVVDVARVLGVSHGTVYRHFPSKAALRDAVTERWLTRAEEPLAQIADETGPALDRLRRWFDQLLAIKRSRAFDDPELFANYLELAGEAGAVVNTHRANLANQLSRIVAAGISEGTFKNSDPVATGRALLDATTRFHNPLHSAEWNDPNIQAAFETVWTLLIEGIMKASILAP